MQFPGEERPPVGVAFDSDLGNSIDDVLALALLYGFDTRRPPEARLISLSISKPNLKAAAFCEAVDRFYTRITNREIPERFQRNNPPPIGLALQGASPEDTPLLTQPLSKRDEAGNAVYDHEIQTTTDTADPLALIRNALTAQHDQNAVVVLTGPATNLAGMLALRGAKDIIAAKVRMLAVAVGVEPGRNPQPAIQADLPAARKLFDEWPAPIVAVSPELGEQLRYPASSIENDFGWTTSHPVVDAYRAFQPMPYDAPATAVAAALHAVRPDEGYFQLSEPGVITVLGTGRTKFTPSPEGKHRYLTLDASKKDLIINTYAEIISTEPPPRELPRFLRRQIEEEQKKKEEDKKRQEHKAQ